MVTHQADAEIDASPDLKRKAKDEELRKEMARLNDQHQASRINSNNVNVHYDVTVCDIQEFIDNKSLFNDSMEIWVFKDLEQAHLRKIELRKTFNFKFNTK
ncbi:MAG: hypothetical protein AB2L20_01030 [Mangrovibacterium sp.]